MVLLLVLSWCWAVERLGGGIFLLHSRFVGFNSRFGQHEFPVRAATGIGRKRLDLDGCFHEENRAWPPNTAKFPASREKSGILGGQVRHMSPTPTPHTTQSI